MRSLDIGLKALIGLAGGVAAGLAIAAAGWPILLGAGAAVEVAGTVWINAILMTILPLVVSKLFVCIAGGSDLRAVGQAGWRAAAWIVGLLAAAAAVAGLLMPAVFAGLPLDPAAAEALRAGAVSKGAVAAAAAPLTLSQWVVSLVPTNAVRAAADNAIVPLLVFFVAFALGATTIAEESRRLLVRFFAAIDAAASAVLGWVVALSPAGVFALGLGLAMRAGAGILTALGYYVVVSSAALVGFPLLLYLVVFACARTSPARFGRAALPAQIMAFGTHSSMASLPAMLAGAENGLAVSRTGAGFVLPLSLALFKFGAPVWFVSAACFVARLYQVPIDPSHMAAVVIAAFFTSFAVGGVPSGSVVVVAPVLAAAGLPVEAIGLLLAVDPIPNGFRTVANVTGMMAVTALAGGSEKREQRTGDAPR